MIEQIYLILYSVHTESTALNDWQHFAFAIIEPSICIYMSVCVCVCVWMCALLCVCAYVCLHMCTYLKVCVYDRNLKKEKCFVLNMRRLRKIKKK